MAGYDQWRLRDARRSGGHRSNDHDNSATLYHATTHNNRHANDPATDNHFIAHNYSASYNDTRANNASSMISCVMPTWRRMRCVERSISLFCEQTVDAELIVFNTDVDHPVHLSNDFLRLPILVINSDIDRVTNQPYRDIGAVRRDALTHATGEHYICWDDDDIFLPWNNRQCLDGITDSEAWAWKPFSSMWSWGNHGLEIAQNVMEASIIARLDKVREHGYDQHAGGGEHLQWIKAFGSKLQVSKYSIPAYSFNWSDPPQIGGHKQSGSIDRADNFEHHKAGCTDLHTRPLRRIDVKPIIREHTHFLESCVGKEFHGHTISPELFEKYAARYL